MLRFCLLLALFASVVMCDEVEQRVLAGLGSGIQGAQVGLGLAELMHGEARDALLKSVLVPVEALLIKADEAAAELGLEGEDAPSAKQLRKDFETPLLRQYLKIIMGNILGPKLTPLITGTNITEDDEDVLDSLLNVTTDVDHIDYVVRAVLMYEKLGRIAIQHAKTAALERIAAVMKRHRIQRSELSAVKAAAMFYEGFEVYSTLGNGTRAIKELNRRNHVRDRHFHQVLNSLKRLHASERSMQIYAGRMAVRLFVSKIACVEDALSHILIKTMDVANQQRAVLEAVDLANDLLRQAYEFNMQEKRFLTATGALLEGVAVANEQSLDQVFRDLLGMSKQNRTTLEWSIALDVASLRRNGRVFAHRAKKEIEALFHACELFRTAEKIVQLKRQDIVRMFKREERNWLQMRKLNNKEYQFIRNRKKVDEFNFEEAVDGDVMAAPVLPEFDPREAEVRAINRFFITQEEEEAEILKHRKAVQKFVVGKDHHSFALANTKPIPEARIERAREFSSRIEDVMRGDALYQEFIQATAAGNQKLAKSNLLECIRLLRDFIAKPFHNSSAQVNLSWHNKEREKSVVPVHMGLRARIFIGGEDVNHQGKRPRVIRSREDMLNRVEHKQAIPNKLSLSAQMRMRGFSSANTNMAKQVVLADGRLELPSGESRVQAENGVNQFQKADAPDGVDALKKPTVENRVHQGSTFDMFSSTVRKTLDSSPQFVLQELRKGAEMIEAGFKTGEKGLPDITEGLFRCAKVMPGQIGHHMYLIARTAKENPDPRKTLARNVKNKPKKEGEEEELLRQIKDKINGISSVTQQKMPEENEITEQEMRLEAQNPFFNFVPQKKVLRVGTLMERIRRDGIKERLRRRWRQRIRLLQKKLGVFSGKEVPKTKLEEEREQREEANKLPWQK